MLGCTGRNKSVSLIQLGASRLQPLPTYCMLSLQNGGDQSHAASMKYRGGRIAFIASKVGFDNQKGREGTGVSS